MPNDISLRRPLPKYISDSLIVVYSDGAGVTTKGKRRHRKANLNTITMHVDAIVLLVWMR